MQSLTNLGNTGNIITDGGSPFGNFGVCLVSGSALELDSNVVSFPIIKSTNFKYTEETKSTEDAAGNVYYLTGGKKEGNLELTTIQNDGDSMKFAETFGGQTISACIELNPVKINGKAQYLYVPYAKVSKNTEIVKPGNEVKLTILPQPSPKAQTVNLPTMTSGFYNVATTGTALSVPAGTTYKVFEY